MHFTLSTAALLIGLSVLSAPAKAQTSFGDAHQQVLPGNEAEWSRSVKTDLRQGLRHATSALSVLSSSHAIRLQVAVAIARDGRIVDVVVTEGSGREAVDQAVVRALSRVSRVQPFTPDMVAGRSEVVVMQMDLGTTY